MPKTSRPRLNREILEEASDWFVDFRVGDVDAVARERFDEWLRRSPENIRAYMEIARTYVELPGLKCADKIDVDALIAYARSGENVVPFDSIDTARANESRAIAAVPHHRETQARAWRAPRPRRRFLAAASCALLLVIAGAVWWQSVRYLTYATDIG